MLQLLLASACSDRVTPGHWEISYVDHRVSRLVSAGGRLWASGYCAGFFQVVDRRLEPVGSPFPDPGDQTFPTVFAQCPDSTAYAGGSGVLYRLANGHWENTGEYPGSVDDLWCRSADELYALRESSKEIYRRLDGSWSIALDEVSPLAVSQMDIWGQHCGQHPVYFAGKGRSLELLDGALRPMSDLDGMELLQFSGRTRPDCGADLYARDTDDQVWHRIGDGDGRRWVPVGGPMPRLFVGDEAFATDNRSADIWRRQRGQWVLDTGLHAGFDATRWVGRQVRDIVLGPDGHIWVLGVDTEEHRACEASGFVCGAPCWDSRSFIARGPYLGKR